jgi:hypothetical protein
MAKTRTRELCPSHEEPGSWVAIDWQERSQVIDLRLKVQHTHADKPQPGKETVEDMHLMLTLDELLQLEDEIRRVILSRLR